MRLEIYCQSSHERNHWPAVQPWLSKLLLRGSRVIKSRVDFDEQLPLASIPAPQRCKKYLPLPSSSVSCHPPHPLLLCDDRDLQSFSPTDSAWGAPCGLRLAASLYAQPFLLPNLRVLSPRLSLRIAESSFRLLIEYHGATPLTLCSKPNASHLHTCHNAVVCVGEGLAPCPLLHDSYCMLPLAFCLVLYVSM